LSKKPNSGLHLLAYIKPDDFSQISRQVGLIASEEVIAQFAEEVRKRLHLRDVAGRFEGTVIMALLERGSERDAEAWAEQLVNYIKDFKFNIDGQDVSVTCTIGICAVSSAFENMGELISAVASAHKRAHSEVSNNVSPNESGKENTKLKRHDALWLKRIKSALSDNRVRLAQLPIAGLRSECSGMYDMHVHLDDEQGDSIVPSEFLPAAECSGMFDMLVRLEDEQGDSILPSEFLPTAERNDMMKTIDRRILTAAIEFCAVKDAECVFVRISKQSLQDVSLVDWMTAEFKRQGVDPGKLCVQVAEEKAARYVKQLKTMAEKIRKLGVRFALEHFGVNKNRYQILDILKPDYIKIDGALMPSLVMDTSVQDGVRQIVQEANQRKIETIAERVENANEMAVLFQIGIHFMQGHYVREPEVVLQEPVKAAQTSLEAIAGR